MNPFELALQETQKSMSELHVEVMLPRMAAAALIGGALSLRPWRLLMRKPLPAADMIQAQILLCAAAAVITAVIGDSLAKAFGLVGLGGFVRFRSGLKDPRDAAILFLVIGLGMACGHGSLALAFVGTGFVAVLLFALDLIGERRRDGPVTLAAETEDPAGVETALRKAFGKRNVLVRRTAMDLAQRRLELELEGADAARIAQLVSVSASTEGPLKGLKWTLSSGGDRKREELHEEAM